MKDYNTMAKWFIEKGYADPKRIGITGFSYGGYMSCYALNCWSRCVYTWYGRGSVVRWELYDSHYTEKSWIPHRKIQKDIKMVV